MRTIIERYNSLSEWIRWIACFPFSLITAIVCSWIVLYINGFLDGDFMRIINIKLVWIENTVNTASFNPSLMSILFLFEKITDNSIPAWFRYMTKIHMQSFPLIGYTQHSCCEGHWHLF